MKPEFTCYNLFDNLDAIGPVTLNILLAQNYFFGPAKGWPSFQTLYYHQLKLDYYFTE
jgi:hypothetical protein